MTTYVTFGTSHEHIVEDIVFNANTVARIEGDSPDEERGEAFRVFGRKFCTTYNELPNMEYFPGGIIDVPKEAGDYNEGN